MKSKHLILIFSMLANAAFSQSPSDTTHLDTAAYFDGRLIVKFSVDYLKVNPEVIPGLLEKHQISSIERSYPASKSANLKRVFTIICDSCNLDSLVLDLDSLLQDSVEYINKVIKPIPMYSPSDYMWSLTTNTQYLWHLKKIQADLAWNISRSEEDIKIAVIDTQFDLNHPDLGSEFAYSYDPFTNQTHDVSEYHGAGQAQALNFIHGTAVASLASGETMESGQTPAGQYAASGFKSKIIGYEWENGLAKAHDAAFVENVEIISISFFSYCIQDYNGSAWQLDDQEAIKEILDHGTTIVAASGNGSVHCNGLQTLPFSGFYDERVIMVSGTNKDDEHTGGQSYYPEIDLCAPGYDILFCLPTIDQSNDPISYPFSVGPGSSFATPITSGVASLLFSENPCLIPSAVQDILKENTDPIIDASTYTFNGISHVGTGRLNAYEAVQAVANYGTGTSAVSSNTTWSDEKFFNQDITVSSGATLTIGQDVMIWFSEGNKLIVEQGAKLICDGCTLTSKCLWGGVEIEGTYNQSQYYSGTYNTNQGIVEIKNEAVVSNAENGVLVLSGGILKTEDAVFLNNYRGVNMYSYQNFAPGYPNTKLPNQCKFINTSFTIDSPVHDYGEPDCGIKMVGVTGVQIKGCTFENLTPVGEDDRGAGIRSLVSGYFVNSICNSTTFPCPSQSLDNNTFTGFEYGIHHLGYGYQNYIPDIRNAEFNCRYGIYASSTDYFKVMDCSFNVINGFTNESANPDRYGLYLDQCSKYTVTRNSFYTNYGFTSQHVAGVIVSAGGPDYNGIIGNHFTGLYHGIEALGNNWQWNSSPGLRFSCNDFSQTKHDVLVYCPPSGYPWPGPCGIGIYQGVYNAGTQQFGPAANRFTHDCGYIPNNKAQTYFVDDWGDSECDVDFLNGSPNLITYYHHNPSGNADVVPLINGADPITNYNTGVSWQGDPETSCLAGVTGYYPLPDGPPFGGPVGLQGESAALAAMAAVRPSIAAARSDYDNLVDDGDTEYYVNEATTVKEADAYALYNVLNGFSPFVSNEVMIALIENEDDFSEILLMQLMTNNSHVVQNEDVLEALNNRITHVNQTELGNLIDYAYANADGMEEFEAKIADMEADYQAALNSLVSIYASDTLPFPKSKDSLRARLDDQNDLGNLLSLVEALYENGYSTDAASTLSSIRSRLTLTSSQDAELAEYEDWFDLRISLPLDSIGLLDTAYLEEIEGLYETTTSNRVWAFTRSLLVGHGYIEYSEPVYFIEDFGPGKRGNDQEKNIDLTSDLRFEIYPNPTSDYLVVDYWITDKKRIKPTVTISNSFGQVSVPIQLQSGSGQDIVPIDLPSGIYNISLDYGSELNLVRQFVVIR